VVGALPPTFFIQHISTLDDPISILSINLNVLKIDLGSVSDNASASKMQLMWPLKSVLPRKIDFLPGKEVLFVRFL
jgi:hypothetical protein